MLAKSAKEIRIELRKKKQLQSAPATSSHNGAGTSREVRLRAEPREAGTSQRSIGSRQDIYRTVPHSAEAEMGVLGSMIKAPREAIRECVEKINESYFYVPAHQVIYRVLVQLWDKGEAIDLILFTQHLRDVGQLDSVGGPGYVTELYGFGAIPENASYYIDILRDKYSLRSIIKASEASARQAYEVDQEPGGGQPKYSIPCLWA